MLPPAVAPSTLSRPRLNAALREATSQRRLTTLIAGPGFGKTTALADWATEQPVAWYTASADDEDAPSLAAGLVAAMRLRAPTLELPIPRAVGQAPDDEGAAGDRAVATAAALAAAVQSAAPSTLVLVVDDVHELGAGSSGAALLDALVRQLPERARVVLAGRDGPPFPVSRLQTRGQAIAFGAADLAFDLHETTAVLRAALGDDVALDRVAELLHARTSGWPAAVRLTADLLRIEATPDRADAVKRILGRTGPIAGPLVAEVLEREPPRWSTCSVGSRT